jgi:hypothetical protein
MLRFVDVLGRWEASELSQLEAAELLGGWATYAERTFRRWCRRYEEEGEAGLLDRRIGKASGKRVPVDRCDEVEALYRTRYSGFTARHFHEHLVRGTRIATPAGEVPVEALSEGDYALTARGQARRIVWIGEGRVLATRGRRTYVPN